MRDVSRWRGLLGVEKTVIERVEFDEREGHEAESARVFTVWVVDLVLRVGRLDGAVLSPFYNYQRRSKPLSGFTHVRATNLTKGPARS